ncbi:MAG: DegV family protein [Thermanaerothrix sp.]|nr:DegV family protein [Thermanaerothrix sp.]
MASIGILTDTTAHFPQPKFPGQDQIILMDFALMFQGASLGGCRVNKSLDLPHTLIGWEPEKAPHLIPPSVEEFYQHYLLLHQRFSGLLVITHLAQLSPTYENALRAAEILHGSTSRIAVINGQTISAGLGLLVQATAQYITQGLKFDQVETLIRRNVPKIYTLLCTPAFSYLAYNGLLSHPQAITGEMLNLIQVFTFEEDRLVPIEKVRNYRHAVEFFIEFLSEFEDLTHVALVQTSNTPLSESYLLRQYVGETFPSTTFTEHKANLPMMTLFGPRFVCLIAVEAFEP